MSRSSWARPRIPTSRPKGRFRLTRGCLEALAEARNPFGIITRGPMIVRDIDVLAEASRRADVHVTFSVPTLDDDDLADHRARDRAAAPAAAGADPRSSTPGSTPASAWPRSCPGCRTGRSCCATS